VRLPPATCAPLILALSIAAWIPVIILVDWLARAVVP